MPVPAWLARTAGTRSARARPASAAVADADRPRPSRHTGSAHYLCCGVREAERAGDGDTGRMRRMVDRYCERLAPPGLAGVVGCLWRSETIVGREQRVLPDGCMDLIWMDGAVHVAGPDSRAFLTVQPPGQVVTGLRFRPGAAPGVFGLPACVLRDQRVRLEDLWPGTTVTQQVATRPSRSSLRSRRGPSNRTARWARCWPGCGLGPAWRRRPMRWAGPNARCTGGAGTHSATARRCYAASSDSRSRCGWRGRGRPLRLPPPARATPTRRIWPVRFERCRERR